jgi:hypothetical protein
MSTRSSTSSCGIVAPITRCAERTPQMIWMLALGCLAGRGTRTRCWRTPIQRGCTATVDHKPNNLNRCGRAFELRAGPVSALDPADDPRFWKMRAHTAASAARWRRTSALFRRVPETHRAAEGAGMKLTEHQRHEIMRRLAAGERRRALAVELGVSYHLILRLADRHLPGAANAGDAGLDQGRHGEQVLPVWVMRAAPSNPIRSNWKVITGYFTARLCNSCPERGHDGGRRASEADSRDVVPGSKVGSPAHGATGRRRGRKPAIARADGMGPRECGLGP